MKRTEKKFFGLNFARRFKFLIVMLIALASLFGGAHLLLGGMHSASNFNQSISNSGELDNETSSINPLGIDDKIFAAGYTINFNLDGGTGTTTSITVPESTTAVTLPTIASRNIQKANYVFDYWYINAKASRTYANAQYCPPELNLWTNMMGSLMGYSWINNNIPDGSQVKSLTTGSSVTLYAHWSPKPILADASSSDNWFSKLQTGEPVRC